MHFNFLDFEQPIAELAAKIEELRKLGNDAELNVDEEIKRLEQKKTELTHSVFSSLSAWQIVQLARHPQRPYFLDYISRIFSDFDELHGDRAFSDDASIIGGVARLEEQPVVIIGQQKGRMTNEKVQRNFGMPKPEGYRKAIRLMKLAERFKLPLLTFIDTPGAYPGVDAEERNQSGAIAQNLQLMSQLKIPIISTIIGEGGSGGALAIGVADRILMLQYSVYSVISPEGCASILWKSAEKAADAADAMAMNAERLYQLKLIDAVIPEPLGGAHANVDEMANRLKAELIQQLEMLHYFSIEKLLELRLSKILAIGTSF
ncbi:acetyl-CoA carboxylase carboxyltransferase subunit alpha [Rickettsiella grylli]|uniref:acetyl-CoA carboxylase carboxyltransferase subunit alpha n=1 Tax=Rickettsiella grylli TaxID=59196 RepID=UPI0008FD823A|nr:acetyl-CoA carboxylase carboxyltransferase subunit alpha [Rickettsiella grylli]OJA00909.1 acetyl-CoA carboxylase carboxyltransferase subunit alpha [Rickettsiella grylli]